MADQGLKLDLQFDRKLLPVGERTAVYAALGITAPCRETGERRPLDLVACMDVSGSMAGEKLLRTKHALTQLVHMLLSDDRLAIVTFSSGAHCVLPFVALTPEHKQRATRAAQWLAPEGCTNMAAGLAGSLHLLKRAQERTTQRAPLKRVLLFTDGHANEGIPESDRLAWESFLRTQLDGSSVSYFGYGEDHDGDFLSHLADLSRGNYYQAADPASIIDNFARELAGPLAVVAEDVRIQVRPCNGAGPVAVLNRCPVEQAGDNAVVLRFPDIFSEQQAHVVLELRLERAVLAPAMGAVRLLEMDVSWLDTVTGARHSVTVAGEVAFGDAQGTDERHPAVLEQVAVLKAAAAQRRAAELWAQGDRSGARRAIARALVFAKWVPTPKAQNVVGLLEFVLQRYRDQETLASSRCTLASLERSLGTMQTTGSMADGLFETSSQTATRRRFQRRPMITDPHC